MGIGGSSNDWECPENVEVSWVVPHTGQQHSPWSKYVLRRYGAGIAATGVASSSSLPWLLKQRLQDWGVRGCGVRLGADFVAFGRELESLSQEGSGLFYATCVRFGDHDRSTWLWYCRAREWLLRLHKVLLEPLPQQPASAGATAAVEGSAAETGVARWSGQPRYLCEEAAAARPPPRAPPLSSSGGAASSSAGGSGGGGGGGVGLPAEEELQLTLFLGNADGHVGVLSLPVPAAQAGPAREAAERWAASSEVPLIWAGQRWETIEDFERLRDTAMNLPDLLVLGLEPDLAMVLTPDWTWEKYPRGFGEVAFAVEEASLVDERPAELGERPPANGVPAGGAAAAAAAGGGRPAVAAAVAPPKPRGEGVGAEAEEERARGE